MMDTIEQYPDGYELVRQVCANEEEAAALFQEILVKAKQSYEEKAVSVDETRFTKNFIEGFVQGMNDAKKQIIQKMLGEYEIDWIASVTGSTVDEVIALRDNN